MRRALAAWGAPALLIALLLAGWQAACARAHIPAYLLPAPSAVAAALAGDWETLTLSALRTLVMALEALAAAALVAAPLAVAGALSPMLGRALKPLAVVAQVTPVVAIAPLVVIWAGLDHPERAITVLAAVVAFFPLYSGLSTGLAAADPDLQRLFDLYGATRTQRLLRLALPSALPFLLEGLKVASGLAVIGAVVAEFVAGSGGAQGLAWRILEAGTRLRTAEMFAALMVLGVMAAALNGGVSWLERVALRRWRGR